MVQIEDLYDSTRLPRWPQQLLLLPYFPIGLVLALLRVFIGLHVFLISCLLPRNSVLTRVVLKTMCAVLGIFVSSDGADQEDNRPRLLVANHVTELDYTAVNLVLPCAMSCSENLPRWLSWMLGQKHRGETRTQLSQDAQQHLSQETLPLMFQPEEACTNSQKGLLKFSSLPFSLDHSAVQPIAISVSQPLFSIGVCLLGSSWWADLFWFLFVPATVFNIRFLPSVHREEDTAEDFARKTQQVLAAHLGVEATNITKADVMEYLKRMSHLPQPEALSTQATRSPGARPKQPTLTNTGDRTPTTGNVISTRNSGERKLQVMVSQVREVLPQVPEEIVRRDLTETGDVDATITNILEGRVRYTPETPPPTPEQASKLSSTPQQDVGAAQMASPLEVPKFAGEFNRSPDQRHMSLQERKQAMYDIARRRYMEKHGLQ
ncbi:PREDICTED: ancient ubiquitous protein 1-like [Branchiostoma belcheri]|uniref:Lipid droplet-regulating VLDL assembly factor AUP1 n=1 Tax=Branchiostoma belcheri TaxID=7741 RepID=A0A6P4Y8N0_BRABE|nr:PREDICTED: ancient ubiquitous protein 1-like [Branchiostoma belcheri]